MAESLVWAWSSITTPLSTTARGSGELGVRLNADADNDEVGGNRFATGQDYFADFAVARQSLDPRARLDVDARLPVDPVEERRYLRAVTRSRTRSVASSTVTSRPNARKEAAVSNPM